MKSSFCWLMFMRLNYAEHVWKSLFVLQAASLSFLDKIEIFLLFVSLGSSSGLAASLTLAPWLGCLVEWWASTPAQANAFANPPCCTRTLRVRHCRTPCPNLPLPLRSPRWRIPSVQAAWPTSCSTSRRSWQRFCGSTTSPGLSASLWTPTDSTFQWVPYFCLNFLKIVVLAQKKKMLLEQMIPSRNPNWNEILSFF